MKKSLLAISAFSVLLFVGAGCSKVSNAPTTSLNTPSNTTSVTETDTGAQNVNMVEVDNDGIATISSQALYDQLGKHVGDKATQGDQMALPYMYESEKVAESLFLAWNTTHELPILFSLSQSHAEQKNVIEIVMGGLQVDLSSAVLEDGKFKDDNIQNLYNKLLPIGNEMRDKAYTSGLLLEESIITNIDTYLERGIDGLSKTIFEAIKESSGKNMKVLNDLLIKDGATYVPQVLSQSEFDSFVK
ncbi:MAG: hypothetical protein COU28_01585 [Candidatus Magasanikbacteria bacterium CG10_big_fil_rev_8_21_14_0_10_36_16]|uniref:DUF2202 domain-containing protein n=1 Tax=Candidatus Magasanikbacteria bacterium CG10_big_fil_rev_8_21_14_0_10_36_16 TaxID=1974645 RepID=A0A2H0TYY9_9BACT|nr:MAG: hypothetical protein COU28_01585 [Candidatus Magasanikbacteria bacterium CG10_big_fil_rev_8_21_14_0_10_36_16]